MERVEALLPPMTHNKRMSSTWVGLTGLAALIGLLLAGCGGTPSRDSIASLSHAETSTSARSSAPVGTGAGGGRGGGGGGPSLNSSSGGGSGFAIGGGGYSQALRYAACMRSHGLQDFPDPSSDGGFQISSGRGIDPGSSQFQAAQKACRKFLLRGGQPPSPAQQAKAVANMLKYAQCMRAHGLPSFPDPQVMGGGVIMRLGSKGGHSGVDPTTPQFQAAQKACQGIIGKGPFAQKTSAGAA